MLKIQFCRIFKNLMLSVLLFFCQLSIKVVHVHALITVHVHLCPFPCPLVSLSLPVCVPVPIRFCPFPCLSVSHEPVIVFINIFCFLVFNFEFYFLQRYCTQVATLCVIGATFLQICQRLLASLWQIWGVCSTDLRLDTSTNGLNQVYTIPQAIY